MDMNDKPSRPTVSLDRLMDSTCLSDLKDSKGKTWAPKKALVMASADRMSECSDGTLDTETSLTDFSDGIFLLPRYRPVSSPTTSELDTIVVDLGLLLDNHVSRGSLDEDELIPLAQQTDFLYKTPTNAYKSATVSPPTTPHYPHATVDSVPENPFPDRLLMPNLMA